ncbi:unnamed protein product [Mytilus edulis]|uniref:Uncharacterized protein n=1 Tax=Mytilus edulis TaxID=6550 RepID=A0A8S3SW57_MYTED|nr:unnamed protein product [Mytilus edulis]
MKNDNVESKKERQIHGIAFSELVSYINETRSCDETISVYKLSDLCKLYTERITCLGADVSSRVNSSRLKDRIVSNFPDLDAYKQGRENILAFKDDIGPALKRVCLEDFDNEFVNISKAATFVRKDIFASNSEFKGTFPKGCQEASVPQSLLSLIKSYSNLPPAVLRFNEPDIPLVEGELSIDMFSFPAALKGEFKWLKHVAENSSVRATVGTNISWSAYHAAVLPDGNKLPAVSALLPLFHEQAKSVAMIRHSLNIIRSAASHVTKTRRAHQVTACTLYRLLSNAYCQYKDVLRDDEVTLEFEDWCLERSKESPHFKFWYTTLRFELTVLIFIRSIREANFSLYIEALSKIIPWFFALDHTNYSRWLPIHLRDMVQLPKTNPETHRAFLEGNFVVNKTEKNFSCMAIDQAHEQNNACVKADGGAVGLFCYHTMMVYTFEYGKT